MKICENGVIRDMTEEEIIAVQDAVMQQETEKKHRKMTLADVQGLFVRQQINTLTVDDQTAYLMKDFYPEWETGQSYPVDYKLVYNGELYKVVTAHTSQNTWLPGTGTESLYIRIDEAHDGTKYDPIPYSGNMALTNGLYYTQSGVLYLCNRDTGNPVYNALSELVGLYVEVIDG